VDAVTSPLASARRVVIKVGSSLLIDQETGLPHVARFAALAGDAAKLRGDGKAIVIVSSGAVALGRRALGMKAGKLRLEEKQAAAAAGQPRLMRAWDDALGKHGAPTAQALLTFHDTEQRRRWLNARATMETLLERGAIPIVNENDTVSVEELRTSFGDNDRLAALVATLVEAPLLVLLSDVPGLYDRHPQSPGAALVPHVPRIDATIEALACDRPGGLSKGGMASKIAAARIVTAAGGACIIASGRDDDVLGKVCRGEPVGTLFSGSRDPRGPSA